MSLLVVGLLAVLWASILLPGALRSRVVDPRFGPVLGQQRELLAPFAMSMALQPDAVALGYAREYHEERYFREERLLRIVPVSQISRLWR
jgi:alkylation response protein AidB-like acyl-CoA dehydrogenase